MSYKEDFDADVPTQDTFEKVTSVRELIIDAVAFGIALVLTPRVVGMNIGNKDEVYEAYVKEALIKYESLVN